MKKLISLSFFILVALAFVQCSDDDSADNENQVQTLSDADGNVYKTITIGKQTWMVENLKTTKYNDGSPITEYTFETHSNNWMNLNTPTAFYQWADTSDLNGVYDKELPFDYHGVLYNHFAIETGKLAPTGWRIPTAEDFKELEAYISANGHEGEEASALKSTFGWLGNNGTDDFGFNVLPAGYAATQGTATGAFSGAILATTDVNPEFPNTSSQTRIGVSFLGSKNTISFTSSAITLGLTIRCIKE